MCFKRKKYQPLAAVNCSEVVLTGEQAARLREMVNPQREFYDAVVQMLDEIEKQNIEIETDELAERLKRLADAYGVTLQNVEIERPKAKSRGVFSCPNCGAPLRSRKCDYCGTQII